MYAVCVYLLVVIFYRHLGTGLSYKGMCFEVSARSGIMRQETAKMRKLLRNAELPFFKKIHRIQGYLLSKGTYNCGTWPVLFKSLFSKFHGSILGMYRDASGHNCPFKDVVSMFSNDDIIYKYNLINPMTILRRGRLSLFI